MAFAICRWSTRARPGDDLAGFQAGRELGIGEHRRQRRDRARGAGGARRFQRVDGDAAGRLFRFGLCELFHGALDRLVILGPRQDHQLVRLGTDREGRLREHRAEHGQHVGSRDGRRSLERVHDDLAGFLGRLLLRHVLDGFRDLLMVDRPRPRDDLARFQAGREFGVAEHRGQRRDRARGAGGARRFQRVDGDAAGRLFRFGLRELFHGALDRLVILGPRQDHQLVRLGTDREGCLREHRAEHGQHVGPRDGRRGLERVTPRSCGPFPALPFATGPAPPARSVCAPPVAPRR